MKSMKRIAWLFVVILLIGFINQSCNKDTAIPEPEDLALQDENLALYDLVFERIDALIDKEINQLEKINFNLTGLKSLEADGTCIPVVTIETEEGKTFPKLITIDYGDECIDEKGDKRAGVITIELTGPYWRTGTKREVTFVNFYFNDLKIEGERKVINEGPNEIGFIVFLVKNEEKILVSEELTIEREVNRKRIVNRGLDLKDRADDEVWVLGYGKGVNARGLEYRNEIVEPLYRSFACDLPFFIKGTVKTVLENEVVKILDYGDGTCDDKATVTKGEVTKEITLKPWVQYVYRP